MSELVAKWGLDRRALFGLSGVLLLLAWWYFSLPTELFFGDDGRLIYTAQHGGFLSRFPDSLFQAELLKYRPIASGVLSLLAPILGANHAAWEAVGKIVMLVASGVFFLCSWFVSKRNLYVSLFLTILFGISRFEYHALTQAWGIFEGVPLVLTLLLMLEAILYFEEEHSGSPARAVFWYGLMIYSYERFLGLIVPLVIFLLLARKSRLLISISIVLVIANAFIKAVFFHFNFLQGTGGQAIHFQVSTLLGFIWVGIANLLGFALTPQYLSGMQFDQLTQSQQVPSFFLLAGIVAIFIATFVLRRPDRPSTIQQWGTPIVVISAFAMLLLTASITFRQEYRFLYPPYAMMLILIAYALGRINVKRATVLALATIVGVAGFLVDAPYHDYVVNTWFGSTAQWLAEAKYLLIDRRFEHANHVVVITHGNDTAQIFTLNPWFFETYDPAADYDVGFVTEPPARTNGPNRFRADTSYYDLGLLHFTQATEDVRLHSILLGARPGTDLMKIRCQEASSAIQYEGWPALYDSVPTITLQPVGVCRLNNVRIRAGDVLTFFAAVPQRSTEWQGTHIVDAARLSTWIWEGKQRHSLIDAATVLPPASKQIRWTYFTASLAPYAGKTVSIEFAAGSPSQADYPGSVAIGLPRITH